MMEFEDFLVARFTQAIWDWPPALASDIFALSLYRDDNNVPYRPAVYLAYNTLSHLREQEKIHGFNAAKWNLAYWPHGTWIGIEDKTVPDDQGRRSVEEWLRARAEEGCTEDEAIIPEFAALCVRVAQRLHRSGVIRDTFGRDIPIIMHDDSWGDEIWTNTAAANPPGVAQEFLGLEVL